MEDVIKGEERSLGKVFSSEYRYVIPDYQRPYAWGVEQAEQLFEDLHEAFQDDQSTYFLGSLVLARTEDNHYEVIDGQQRLSTLAMLLAALISNLPKDQRTARLAGLLYDEDGYFADAPKEPRVLLRTTDRNLLNDIQTLNIGAVLKLELSTLPETQRLIQHNMQLLNERVCKTFGENLQRHLDFIAYLLGRCYVVAVTSNDRDTAFRMFSVLNSRGLDLSAVDLIKASTLHRLSAEDQHAYAEKWDEVEKMAGPAAMNEALGHLRFILSPEKSRISLLEEMNAIVQNVEPRTFLDNQFLPAVRTHYAIKDNKVFEDNPEAVAAVRCLNRINNADWMPVAILYLTTSPDRADAVPFFAKLERLAAYLQTKGFYVNTRLKRYGSIIKEMKDADSTPFSQVASLDLTEDERREFLETLNSDLYTLPGQRCRYILLRLNDVVSDGSCSVEDGKGSASVEHVLPQNPEEGSEWATWDEDQRKYWTHRLANLVLLSKRMNSAARNYDFDRKKQKYFSGESVASFPLTAKVAAETEWTPEVLERRQEELVGRLKELWGL